VDIRDLQDKLFKTGVLPVIAIESPEQALPMADALIDGGLPVAEGRWQDIRKAAAEAVSLVRKLRG
jgi:2-dehydro-3-deoxyphosphogluconate aldolase/(4S)-4-hydroxy-2-oxoglutarate aldolase